MAKAESITVGNYVYTTTDANRTLLCLNEIWQHHIHESVVPEGWLAGARGCIAELASLAGTPLPSLDDVDSAFQVLGETISHRIDTLVPAQKEALLAAMWRFFPTMRLLTIEHTGVVAHLHASKGLPKKSIDHAIIGWRGIEGDVQSSRVHHGRPWQALCIWSTDSLERLQNEGHPIQHGYAGENITVSNIPAQALRPGAHFQIGTVRGFLTSYSIPCKQNKDWFADGDFMRMSHERGADSRVYAMVTRTGEISVGDTVQLFTDR